MQTLTFKSVWWKSLKTAWHLLLCDKLGMALEFTLFWLTQDSSKRCLLNWDLQDPKDGPASACSQAAWGGRRDRTHEYRAGTTGSALGPAGSAQVPLEPYGEGRGQAALPTEARACLPQPFTYLFHTVSPSWCVPSNSLLGLLFTSLKYIML